ncbi:MAG: hypothetical protein ACKO3R_08335 [bacterium]
MLIFSFNQPCLRNGLSGEEVKHRLPELGSIPRSGLKMLRTAFFSGSLYVCYQQVQSLV